MRDDAVLRHALPLGRGLGRREEIDLPPHGVRMRSLKFRNFVDHEKWS